MSAEIAAFPAPGLRVEPGRVGRPGRSLRSAHRLRSRTLGAASGAGPESERGGAAPRREPTQEGARPAPWAASASAGLLARLAREPRTERGRALRSRGAPRAEARGGWSLRMLCVFVSVCLGGRPGRWASRKGDRALGEGHLSITRGPLGLLPSFCVCVWGSSGLLTFEPSDCITLPNVKYLNNTNNFDQYIKGLLSF